MEKRQSLSSPKSPDSQTTPELETYPCGSCFGGSCFGFGQCNDADLGDISFNEWKCLVCNGTGWITPKP